MGLGILVAASLVLLGCSTDHEPETCAAPAPAQRVVVTQLVWGAADRTGARDVVPGLDLDGLASTSRDDLGCNQPDVRWPADAETASVDNMLGPLVVGFDTVNADGDYAGAIAAGSLLITLELGPTDDTSACARAVTWLDGDTVLTTTPFRSGPDFVEVSLPERISFPVYVDARRTNGMLQRARVHVDISDPAAATAVIGGAVALEEAVRVGVELAEDPSYEDLIRSLVTSSADLVPDPSGTCQGISAGWLLTGTLE